MTIANETVNKILERVELAQPRLAMPYKDLTRTQFEEKNKAFKLHFNPVVYDTLVELSKNVYKQLGTSQVWNGSVSDLYEVPSMLISRFHQYLLQICAALTSFI